MKKISTLLAVTLLFGGAAFAETTDSTLLSPGCYLGSGCDPNGWASSVAAGTELGLAAIIDHHGAPGYGSNPGSIVGNTYYIPYGNEAVAGTPHAMWNFSWSINTNLDGQDSQPLSNFTYLLSVDDLTLGTHFQIDPSLAVLGPNTQGDWGLQNSENPSFGFISAPLHFNSNNLDNYHIVLTETSIATGLVVNQADINVDIVSPEPSTITLAGLALVGLGLLRRRQMQRS